MAPLSRELPVSARIDLESYFHSCRWAARPRTRQAGGLHSCVLRGRGSRAAGARDDGRDFGWSARCHRSGESCGFLDRRFRIFLRWDSFRDRYCLQGLGCRYRGCRWGQRDLQGSAMRGGRSGRQHAEDPKQEQVQHQREHQGNANAAILGPLPVCVTQGVRARCRRLFGGEAGKLGGSHAFLRNLHPKIPGKLRAQVIHAGRRRADLAALCVE